MGEKKMTNREYLVCIDTKLKGLKEQFDNHLRHHWAITISLLGSTGGLIAALLVVLLS